jgi:hypothetical protein
MIPILASPSKCVLLTAVTAIVALRALDARRCGRGRVKKSDAQEDSVTT